MNLSARESALGAGAGIESTLNPIQRADKAFRAELLELDTVLGVAHVLEIMRVGACDDVDGVEDRVKKAQLREPALVGKLGGDEAAALVDLSQHAED